MDAIPCAQLEDEEYDRLVEYVQTRNYQGLPAHQFLELPDAIQGDGMEIDCQLASRGVFLGNDLAYQTESAQKLLTEPDAQDWTLLLQLDTDEYEMGWMWGDMGRLYFFVRREDARAGRFDRVWVQLQCF